MCGIWLGSRAGLFASGAFVGLLALTEPAVAQDFSLVTTLVHENSRPSNEDRFGCDVALGGGYLFVGAKDEQGANDYSGVVRVFSDADWSEVAQLKSSRDADIQFGSAIAVDGERALISNAAIDNGVVWLFEKIEGAWTEKLRVQGVLNEAFGYRLALRGDFAFAAAPRLGTGNVHVYRRTSGEWAETQVLTADDAQAEDFFGYSLAFDGERLAVAAPGNLLGPKRAGVYTFSLLEGAFVQDGKLTGDELGVRSFGDRVALQGDTLIVNAPPAYQVKYGGKALVYQRRGESWELDSELSVEGEEAFPADVAIDGDRAWFGARTLEPRAFNVYAFQRASGAWEATQKLDFPNLGQAELTSWDARQGTFAIGFWNGLRTESVRVYRGADYERPSSGGSPNGSGGADAAGGKPSGDGAGGGAGDTLGTSGSGAAAGNASSAESSDSGGCAFARSSRSASSWMLALLGLALISTRKRARR